jgi:phosphate transport system substrate-binding protein
MILHRTMPAPSLARPWCPVKGAIGYVQYGITQRAGLSMAWLENKAGQFIQPHGGSGLATLIHAQMLENLRVFFPDPDSPDAYPSVTYSWLLLYKEYGDSPKHAVLQRFVRWCLTEGQAFNESLGYLRLAPHVVTLGLEAVQGRAGG